MEQKKCIKILYVDSEEYNLTAFSAYFRRMDDFEITTSLSIEETLKSDSDFNVLIIDHAILKSGEDVVCQMLKNEGANMVKIVVTTYRDITRLESYLASGELYDCLAKPIDFECLGRIIEQAYRSYFK